jgi:hypothetical protein
MTRRACLLVAVKLCCIGPSFGSGTGGCSLHFVVPALVRTPRDPDRLRLLMDIDFNSITPDNHYFFMDAFPLLMPSSHADELILSSFLHVISLATIGPYQACSGFCQFLPARLQASRISGNASRICDLGAQCNVPNVSSNPIRAASPLARPS